MIKVLLNISKFTMDQLTEDEIIHKLKSPLTAIMGYSDMVALKLKKGEMDEKALEWLAKVKIDALTMRDLIERLEELRRLQRQ